MSLAELDAIKARARQAPGDYTKGFAELSDVPRLVAALEAVMELHKEVGNAGIDGCECGCGGYEPWCSCGQGDYPCPTVTAITRALEGEPNG